MGSYHIPLPLVCTASHDHWPLVGRAAACDWWEGHLIAIGGKGNPLPFDVILQDYNQDIRMIS